MPCTHRGSSNQTTFAMNISRYPGALGTSPSPNRGVYKALTQHGAKRTHLIWRIPFETPNKFPGGTQKRNLNVFGEAQGRQAVGSGCNLNESGPGPQPLHAVPKESSGKAQKARVASRHSTKRTSFFSLRVIPSGHFLAGLNQLCEMCVYHKLVLNGLPKKKRV